MRNLLVRRYPYLVYYLTAEQEIAILSIKHAARKRDYDDE